MSLVCSQAKAFDVQLCIGNRSTLESRQDPTPYGARLARGATMAPQGHEVLLWRHRATRSSYCGATEPRGATTMAPQGHEELLWRHRATRCYCGATGPRGHCRRSTNLNSARQSSSGNRGSCGILVARGECRILVARGKFSELCLHDNGDRSRAATSSTVCTACTANI